MRTRTSLLVLAVAALAIAGCERQGTSSSTSQKLDQSTPKSADATSSSGATASESSSNMSAAAGDTAITAKVKAALIAEPGLKSMDINVETKDGTVTLTGSVDNAQLREKAKQVASSTSGVKGVIDNLNIKTTS